MNILISVICFSAFANGARRRMDRFEYFSQINVNISWSINIRTQSVYVELIAPVANSDSWIAFGISDSGGMKGADIALISLYHNKIYDLHSLDFVQPMMDKVQNYELRYLEVLEQHTIVQFRRKLITCDADDYDLDTTTLRHNILIAYHTSDPQLHKTQDYQLYISRHQVTQTKSISIYIKNSLFTSDAQHATYSFVDITVNKHPTLNQSAGSTQHLCYPFNNTQERYVIAAALLDPTPHRNLVHRATIDRCSTTELVPNITDIHACDVENELSYDIDMECNHFVVLANGSTLAMPDTVEYLWTQDVYILKIQFDLSHVTDSNHINITGSGIRLYYSNIPRTLQLGVTKIEANEFEIPPHKQNYALSVLLPSECSNRYLPTNGVDIISFTAHMHHTANAIQLDRIRTPNEVETLYYIKQFDSDRQLMRMVHFTLQPGDMLRMTCYFDTSDRDEAVVSGRNPEDELCQIYIGYVNTQKIPGINHIYSVPVSGFDALLNPSYCGQSLVSSWDQIVTSHSQHIYENIHNITTSNKGLEIMDDTNGMCADLVFSKINLIPNDLILRFDLVFITLYPGILLLLTILLSLNVLEKLLDGLKPGIYAQFEHSISDKRKINVYLFSTLFFSFLLFDLIYSRAFAIGKIYLSEPEYKIIYYEYTDLNESEDQMNMYPYHIPFVSNLVMLFFGIELFYRFRITWPLLLHHIFTICIVMTLCLIMQTTLSTASAIKIGFWYLMQVATEQPIFLALYIRKLQLTCCGCIKKEHYPYLFYFAAIWHYITKISTTVFISYYHIQSLVSFNVYEIYDHSFRSFLKDDPVIFAGMNCEKVFTVLLTVLIPLLFTLQMYQGIFFWKLGVVRTKKTLIALGADQEPIIIDADHDEMLLPEIPSGKSVMFEEKYALDDDELNEVRMAPLVMQLTTSIASWIVPATSTEAIDGSPATISHNREMPHIVPSSYGYKSNTLIPYGSTYLVPQSVSNVSSMRIQEIVRGLRRDASLVELQKDVIVINEEKMYHIAINADMPAAKDEKHNLEHESVAPSTRTPTLDILNDKQLFASDKASKDESNNTEDDETTALATSERTEIYDVNSSARATGELTEITEDQVAQEHDGTSAATSYPPTETELQTWASTKL